MQTQVGRAKGQGPQKSDEGPQVAPGAAFGHGCSARNILCMTFDPPRKAEGEPGTFSHVHDLNSVGIDATLSYKSNNQSMSR